MEIDNKIKEAQGLIKALLEQKKESCPTTYSMYLKNKEQVLDMIISIIVNGSATSYEKAITQLENNYKVSAN